MADLVKYFTNTEEAILSLTPEDPQWIDKAFYYPVDRSYFYRVVDGIMKKYASGIGVSINGETIGGVKNFINLNEILDVPVNYEYNVFNLSVEGDINCDGNINIM